MRRVTFAPFFDEDVESIGVYIEETFGEQARRSFISKLRDVCLATAAEPCIELPNHGYHTSLLGAVFQANWIGEPLCISGFSLDP
jgi:plasmid stabilization system protein ParE